MKHALLLCLTFAAIIVNSCKTENPNNLETIFCNTEHADSTMGQYIENVSVLVLETGDNVIRNADKISFLNEKIYIGDFVELFSGHLSRKQVRGYIEKLVEGQMLKQDGDGKMRSYSLSEQYESRMAILSQAVEIGLNAMNERSKGQK